MASCFPQYVLYQELPTPFPLHPFVLISVPFFPFIYFLSSPLLIYMTLLQSCIGTVITLSYFPVSPNLFFHLSTLFLKSPHLSFLVSLLLSMYRTFHVLMFLSFSCLLFSLLRTPLVGRAVTIYCLSVKNTSFKSKIFCHIWLT